MLSKEEVKHIAKLARLGLTEKEIGKYQKDLSNILEHFEKLKEVKVSGVEPMSHSIRVENVTRSDAETLKSKVQRPRSTERSEAGDEAKPQRSLKLLGQAPETKNDYLKTRSILK